MAVKDLRVMGRATQGVRLIRIDDGDEIAAVAKVDADPVEDIEEGEIVDGDVVTEEGSLDINKTNDPEDKVDGEEVID